MDASEMTRQPAGIDIGSTTAKAVICDGDGGIRFSRYRRHNARPVETVREMLREALDELGDIELDLAVTGSAGMGISETLGIPFVQEVVASTEYIKSHWPDVRTFIEIGGEDSKIVFLDDRFRPDIRMNGSCAGGTGAFIDQMAILLDVPVSEFNALSEKAKTIYPIASRCGVFAKTDIQALLSRDASREDIAASVFRAVALQVVTGLARGRDIRSKILFGGGPLTFFPELRKAFVRLLGIDDVNDIVIPERPKLVPALGAATARARDRYEVRIGALLALRNPKMSSAAGGAAKRLPPLFRSNEEYETWLKEHSQDRVERVDPAAVRSKELFLGVDSGSTTTKLVLIDGRGRFVFGHYVPNNANPIEAVKQGLAALRKEFTRLGFEPKIVRATATGYGEDLVKAALGLDDGVVETMAHYRAAHRFTSNVSFILDIGGQDMKAIYIRNQAVSDIQVNEACSSGCGSFIETFAGSLGYDLTDFTKMAREKNEPFDLGTRCTVFMNSRVKQALREGASVPDIAAGLAYSVVKNALYKVLKLRDVDVLGDVIVAQGGTFRNHAVLRALELLLEKTVIRPDIAELMGAYGAALTALSSHASEPQASGGFRLFGDSDSEIDFTSKEIECHGCENRCTVSRLTFSNGKSFFTGNRCERHFSNSPKAARPGRNLISEKLGLLFDRPTRPDGAPILTFGIPRCLNMYEDFPFWSSFLKECGFGAVVSSPSNAGLLEKGASSVTAENICFPAKLVHGHIVDLVEKGVDRIFYPLVVHEHKEFPDVLNSYNCPIVTGYPDVIRSAIDPEKRFDVPLESPAVSFRDVDLLKKQLHLFFKRLGVDFATVSRAVDKGLAAHRDFKRKLKEAAAATIEEAKKAGRMVVVLAGRPYHVDPLINHGIPELLCGMGVDVITEDSVPLDPHEPLCDVNVLTQWTYTNRLYAAAKWVRKEEQAQLIQLTSFGCGPDAISTDEVRDILNSAGKIYTLLKMDEVSNLGAMRIRIRSMLEAVKENRGRQDEAGGRPVALHRAFAEEDRTRTLIAPFFSPFYSPLLPAAFRPLGYKVEVLPPQSKESVEYGLKNVNNEICYPAVLIAGDIIHAFQSGRYDPARTAVLLTQTGGQCRASNYVALLKKALSAAGLSDTPVISISTENINPQPGFVIDEKQLAKRFGLGVVFADALTQMYLATVVREEEPGTTKTLHAKYLSEMEHGVEAADYYYLSRLLEEAVADFNAVRVAERPVPKIGVVGEIFVSYNFFANGHIIDWLSRQGVEVVLPTLQSFFAQRFVNEDFDQRSFFKHSYIDRISTRLTEIYVRYHLFQIDRIMQGFRFYRKPVDLKKLAEIAGEVVSLANQFGEGWLLTADIIAMLEDGVGNIACLQPFGCISNHITGKGLERKLKEMFPHMNLLSLDMDAGASEVNILNRLQFLVMAAREEMEYETEVTVPSPAAWSAWIPRIYPRDVAVFNHYLSPEMEKWKSWVAGLGLWKKGSNFMKRFQ
jgi:predicted CoA-substrate-specific enzyme activase